MTLEEQVYSLKTAVIVMSILLVGCFFYIFQFSHDTKTLVKTVTVAKTERELVKEQLERLKASYEDAISKTVASASLIAERDKVIAVWKVVNGSNGNPAEIAEARNNWMKLEISSKDLLVKNSAITSTASIPDGINTSFDSLANTRRIAYDKAKAMAEELKASKRAAELASKIVVSNLVVNTANSDGKGDNAMQISFTVEENKNATLEPKEIQVQIIDSKNNVLGERRVLNFGEKTLTYSFSKSIDHKNKSIDVSQNIAIEALQKGIFYVNVFYKGKIIAKTSSSLFQ